MCVCTWAVPNLPIPGIGSTEYLHPMMDTLYFSFIYSIFFLFSRLFPTPSPLSPLFALGACLVCSEVSCTYLLTLRRSTRWSVVLPPSITIYYRGRLEIAVVVVRVKRDYSNISPCFDAPVVQSTETCHRSVWGIWRMERATVGYLSSFSHQLVTVCELVEGRGRGEKERKYYGQPWSFDTYPERHLHCILGLMN